MVDWNTPFEELPIGKGRKLRDGKKIAILSIGHMGNTVAEAIEELAKSGITPAHYDLRFVKPLDTELLHQVMQEYPDIITIEDGTLIGGMGSAVVEFASDNNYKVNIHRMGIPDRFIDQGTPEELFREIGLDQEGIFNNINQIFNRNK